MRPAHIRLFDGLRMTTEHLEHLQGAFVTAIEELRMLNARGTVVHGFEVEPADDGSVIVQPGLAFDNEGQRIVCDDPQRLSVAFAADQEDIFVCVAHRQIEDGEVEGTFTLIWDACDVSLKDTPPGTDDNLVVLARLVRTDGGFDILSDDEAQPPRPAEAEPGSDREEDATPEEAAGNGAAGGREPAEVAGSPAGEDIEPESGDSPAVPVGPAGAAGVAGAEESEIVRDIVESERERPTSDAEKEPAPMPTASSAPDNGRLRIAQGTTALAGNGPVRLPNVFLEALRRTTEGAVVHLSFPLTVARVEVEASYPASINFHSRLAGEWRLTLTTELTAALGDAARLVPIEPEAGAAIAEIETTAGDGEDFGTVEARTEPFSAAASSSEPGAIRFKAHSSGEASLLADRLEQWSTSHFQAGLAGDVSLRTGIVAYAPLAPAVSAGELPDVAMPLLGPLSLQMRLERAPGSVLQVRTDLVWNGAVSEPVLEAWATATAEITWQAELAWKVLATAPSDGEPKNP